MDKQDNDSRKTNKGKDGSEPVTWNELFYFTMGVILLGAITVIVAMQFI